MLHESFIKSPIIRHHSQISSEGFITEIISFQLNPCKRIVYYLLCIFSLGLVYLLCRWNINFWLYLSITRVSPLKASYFCIIAQDNSKTIVPSQQITIEGSYYVGFTFRYYHYYYNSALKCFEPIETNYIFKKHSEIYESIMPYMNQRQIAEALIKFGYNSLTIPDKGILSTLLNEILSPFYIFQIFSIFVWLLTEYYTYSVVILFFSLVSISITLHDQRKNFRRLQRLSEQQTEVLVLRNSELQFQKKLLKKTRSQFLLPGDIIEIHDGIIMPCDAILLNGQCVVNESMITGESIPVLKMQLPFNNQEYRPFEEGKQFTLFSGTQCLEVKIPNKQNIPVLALVTQTGFDTMKGKLIRSILFPQSNIFKFYSDSMKFLLVMGIISLLGFLITTPTKLKYVQQGFTTYNDIFLEGLTLLTIAVPPALPTCLQIGTSVAMMHLKEFGIYCIAPSKVNIFGKITVMCFDKTGTLTENNLDIYGIRPVGGRGQQSFQKIKKDFMADLNEPQVQTCIQIMASCHCLAMTNQQLIGDPLEIKMFEASGWELDEMDDVVRYQNKEIFICKRYEFSSTLNRMSVVVRIHDSYRLFVKGAPEKIQELCSSSSIPKQYNRILDFYAENGYRVIALASRNLPDLNEAEIYHIQRDQIEVNLIFAGFLIMENKLKPISQNIIDQLTEANIRSIMVTGDNILTAINVARQCSIINSISRVYLADLDGYQIQWKDFETSCAKPPSLSSDQQLIVELEEELEDERSKKDSFKEISIEMKDLSEQENYTSKVKLPWKNYQENFTIAITGRALNHLQSNNQILLQIVLEKAQVYARMKPEDKTMLMKLLQEHLPKQPLIGFCGDGANDCGALRQADGGVSISNAEASVAAPFTSKIEDISCIPRLLIEGRSALATSFQCFKYMALYAMIQFISCVILYFSIINLTNNQFLYVDLLIILPLSFAMAMTQPSEILSQQVPESALISSKVLISVIGQTVLVIIFQSISMILLIQQSWFISTAEAHEKYQVETIFIENYENTVENQKLLQFQTIFLFSNFQYIFVAIAFSEGKPFRKAFYTNKYLMLATIFILSITTFILLQRNQFLDQLLQITRQIKLNDKVTVFSQMPTIWIQKLTVLVILNLIAIFSFEKIFLPQICSYIKKKKQQQ